MPAETCCRRASAAHAMSSASPCPGSASATCGATSPAPVPTRRRRRARAGWIDLATRIKLTYAQHHVHLTSIRYAQENLDLMRRVAEIARTRYASGFGSQQDALRAQSEIIAMETDLVMLEGESAQPARACAPCWGARKTSSCARRKSCGCCRRWRSLDMVALEARLRANNPLLAADDARIAGAEKGRDLVERNRYPDVNLGIAPTQVRNRVAEWELMFEINIPLQQGSRRAQEREAELNLEAARLRRQGTLNQALAELSESVAGLDVARRLESLVTTGLLPQAELNLNAALAAYENGRMPILPRYSTRIGNCAAPAANWSRRAATSRSAWPRSRRWWEKNYEIPNAGRDGGPDAGAGRRILGRRTRKSRRWRHGDGPMLRRHRGCSDPRHQARKLLYYRNPDGPARHFAGAEEGLDGHGLHRRL
jgi:hypothetical protein